MKYPLTTQQRNIWNLQKAYNNSITNISGYIVFDAVLDKKKLAEAINLFVKSQEGMRLVITEDGKDIFQTPFAFRHFDIPVLYFEDDSSAKWFFEKDSLIPFDPNNEFYRFYIFTIKESTGIYLCFNHLIADAWSASIFCNSVIKYYQQLSEGSNIEIVPGSYLDYIEKESKYVLSRRFARDKEYWEKYFSEKPVLSYIVPERKESIDGRAQRHTQILGPEMSMQIQQSCSEYGISPAVLFEAAVFIYLHRINGCCKENIIGIPVLNRTTSHEKETMGMFISTMLLGIRINDKETVISLFKDISAAHNSLFRHQQYPYSDILRYLRNKYNFSGNLFDVIVSYQNARITSPCQYKFHTEWLHNGYSEIPLAIHIDDRDNSGCFTLNFDYQTTVFTEEHIILLVNRIIYIIKQMVSDSTMLLNNIRILPEEEYNKVIYGFNDTYSFYSQDKCIHELFAEQVEKSPDKIALIFEDEEFTYRQLDEMSNSLAHYLREETQIKSNDIVPLISKRSWHIVVAMLGILKAGGAYMPVDPTYPKERIDYMVSEAKSKVALAYGFKDKLSIRAIDMEEFDFNSSIMPVKNITSPTDTCYVIFTSGSTGKPKGTLLRHRGLNNFSNGNNVFYKAIFNGCDRVLSIGALTFDISTGEIFQPILNGGCLVIAGESAVNSADEIARLIEVNCIDLIHITPSRLMYYLSNGLFRRSVSRIKTILSAGEAFSTGIFTEIRKYSNARIFNGYGPTEATIGSTFAEIKNSDDIVIGKPMSNVQIYILDPFGNLCPIGVPGELCISGDGVAKGYLNHPELTAEKFVQNPFADGKIMYKSGDLAKWRPNGDLEYLGRIDTQVKIRGLRIELGEIESVMGSFDGINMSAVADKKNSTGRQYLVGYYTSEKEINEKSLRRYLSSKLPRYMVPNYFMRLDEMPMTASGKTDRKNLPFPEISMQEGEYAEPSTFTERILCETIQELFNGHTTGVNDNFFECGGDSLLAMQLAALLSAKGIIINVQDIYDYPTPSELGAFVDSKKGPHYEYTVDDYKKYDTILKQSVFDIPYALQYNQLGNVLITGATGFLGAHLLDTIFDREEGKIYCLVRGADKLRKILKYYFGRKYDGKIDNRIIPINGDITDISSLSALPTDVDTVIHSAANVKHYGNYSVFEQVNVIGTKNMLAYADSIKSQFIYISTTSVGGIALKEGGNGTVSFSESDFYIGQSLDNVYIRSKFEAETLVLDKILAGMKCRIFRIGNLTSRFSDGMFQPNYRENAFLKRIKVFLDAGMIPDILSEEYIEMTPVDLAAIAIVLLLEYADERKTVFHISNSDKSITYSKFADLLTGIGIDLSVKDTEHFLNKIKSFKSNESSAVLNELNELKHISGKTKVVINSKNTTNLLLKAGFCWENISEEYLKKYFVFLKRNKYYM